MNEGELRAVRAIALRVRESLERVGPESGVPGLTHFPRNSCADAVLLLGACLIDKGVDPFEAVGGEFETDPGAGVRSHAWLERDGVIVDITADQFPGISERVIVTCDPTWHRRFRTNNRGVADFRGYGPEVVAQLGPVYEKICEVLR